MCCQSRDFRALFKHRSVQNSATHSISLSSWKMVTPSPSLLPWLGSLVKKPGSLFWAGSGVPEGRSQLSSVSVFFRMRAPVCNIDPAYLWAESNVNHTHG